MTPHTVKISQLVRRSAQDVFNAFADATQITRFWLDAASASLAEDAVVTWHFMVPGATETVTVTEFAPPRRIAFDWSDGLHVVLAFEDQGTGQTRVSVQVDGFAGKDAVAQAINATEGFSIVLCELKTWLETGRAANLVRDKAALIAAAMAESRSGT